MTAHTNVVPDKKWIIGIILLTLSLVSLFIDHIGALMNITGNFHGTEVKFLFRAAGRISFPILALFCAEWLYRAGDLNKFIKILFVVAIISELATRLAYNDWDLISANPLTNADTQWVVLNLTTCFMFTFLFAALGVWIYERMDRKKYGIVKRCLPAFALALLGTVLGCSFFGFGVFLIFVLYVIRDHFPEFEGRAKLVGFYYRMVAYLILMVPMYVLRGPVLLPFAFIGILLAGVFDGKLGKNTEYIFYVFYPLHFIVIYALMIVF